MKGFIGALLLGSGIAGALWFLRASDVQTCRSAGYDGMKGDLCVYHSRFVKLDYTTAPRQASAWMPDIRGYEERRRRHED